MRAGGTDRFEALLEASPDGILVVDRRGRIRLVNQRAEALFGYGRDELFGAPVEMLVPDGARDRHLGHRVRYAASPRTRPMGEGLELSGRRRDGTEFPAEISLRPLGETDDADELVITIVRDLSERRLGEAHRIDLARSEMARLASEAESERLRQVQSLFDEALTWLSSTDRMLAVALERTRMLMGADAAAILIRDPGSGALRVRAETGIAVPSAGGTTQATDVAAATAPEVFDELAGVVSPLARDTGLRSLAGAPVRTGGETAGVVHVASRRAQRFTADDAVLLARFAERIALVLGQARVFESQRAAAAAARAAETRLRELLGDLAAVVWEADGADRRRYRFISDGVEALLGRPASEWLERDGLWREFIDPADRARVLDHAAAAMEHGEAHELEYRVVVPGRGVVWLRDLVRPVRLETGEVRLRGVTADVTERRELEARLLQGQKMQAVGQLAGGVAHDFNNLLTVIIGLATMMSGRLADEQDVADLGEILGAAERAQALTRQLVSFSRRHSPRTGLVDLNEAVAGLEPVLRRLLDTDIDLTVRLGERAVLVEADPSQLEQVVMNLVVNARDAMPAGGSMQIEVNEQHVGAERAAALGRAPGPCAVLAVADTGTGMSPEVRERVFEPFYTTKEPGAGTGLGLATVYGIVDRADGTIVIESDEGRGTEVAVLLPLAHAPPASAAPERTPAGAPQATEPVGARVLVVEDEDALRALISRVLGGDGWNVLEARDGREALGMLDRAGADVDLLITDIVMPEMGGPELVSRITARLPDLPVIYTSGYSDGRLAGHGIDETSPELLRKPFLPEELRRRAREALEGRGPREVS